MKKVTKLVLLILISLFCATVLAEQGEIDSIAVKERIDSLILTLKKGESISPFLQDSILFVYHEDNRCDGSTDGSIQNLPNSFIDTSFSLKVTNDGNGWACKKSNSKEYILEFNFNKTIQAWDRIEYDNINYDQSRVFIAGSGESDYLILEYVFTGNTLLFSKIEFRSEDPG